MVSKSRNNLDSFLRFRLVRENEDSKERITQIVDALVQEFVYSNNAYARYGGLIGLAATSIALGPVNILHLYLGAWKLTIFLFDRVSPNTLILLFHLFYLVLVTKIKKFDIMLVRVCTILPR